MRQLRDATYDAVIVGGGLAGSSLAARLAKHGKRVLVLERTRQFRDRVRGEGMHSWGVPELRALGLYDRLMETCAHEARYWVTYGPPALARARDLIQTTPHHAAVVDFYHPRMQEVLLRLAAEAGAEIGRGVSITHICGAHSPAVKARCEGREARFRARLVVGADGRHSAVRRDAGFTVARDPERIRISGVLLAGMRTAEDAVHVFVAPTFGHVCLLFPLGGERFRVYFTTGRRREHRPLSGAGDIAEFCRYCIETGVPAQWIGHARMAGPLATFEGADVWVDHPYAEGIVLVGDAAAANDPCFGSGLSLTLRDVRVLVDLLSTTDDWDAAGHRYAAAHDRYYGSLHKITSWLREVRYALGPEADRLREHALPRLADGSGPDLIGMGPEARADACAVLADRVT